MFGLTNLGVVHTAVGLVAVACGLWALVRDRHISLRSGLGKAYVATTAITAITGLFIFQHGGFGPPHVLSLLTLLALAGAMIVSATTLFGRYSSAISLSAMSLTMLFHMIPGFTESLTRLPPGKPVLASAEAPEFKVIYGALLVVFVIGLVWQLRWLKWQEQR